MRTIKCQGDAQTPPGMATTRLGGSDVAKRTESERFWAKVDRSGGPDACWPWLGFVRPNGYGIARVGRMTMQASRRAWILTVGPIPEGLVIDHLCHGRDAKCSGELASASAVRARRRERRKAETAEEA